MSDTDTRDGETFANFDFGLTADQEERAARLHRESIVIDNLFQGPYGYRSFDEDMNTAIKAYPTSANSLAAWLTSNDLMTRRAAADALPDYEACWRGSGLSAAAWEFQVISESALVASTRSLTMTLDAFPWLVKATTADDIIRAKAAGKTSIYLQCQPTGLNADLGLLYAAYDLGLRQQMLTYNNQDLVGSGCTERHDGGLSNFGVTVVRTLNDLGVIVDTAHCGRQTTLDACTFSETPVIASHTTAQSLYAHDRGKSDEELDALAGTGGMVSLCAVPFFLSPDPHPTINVMLDHIDYVVQRIGWEHVGLGMDWPLPLPKWVLSGMAVAVQSMGFRAEHNICAETNLAGFDDYRDFPNVTRGLVGRGYTDEQITGILGGNFLKLFRSICG